MGCILDATCTCGYHGSTHLGAGMANFMTQSLFPHHCSQCRAIVDADLMAASPTCPTCGNPAIVPYTDPELHGEPGLQEVADCMAGAGPGQRASLSDGTYFCPACEKPSLRFRLEGCFD